MTGNSSGNTPVNVFWFRRDLRLHDNAGLFQALNNGLPVLPVFIFDTNILDALQNKHDARVAFIHKELKDLNSFLEKKGKSLLIKYGAPEKIWKQLVQEFNIQNVFFNNDYEPYATERDAKIGRFLESQNIGFHASKDQVIFEKDEILTNANEPYKVYTPYKNKWREQLAAVSLKSFNSQDLLNNFISIEPFGFPELKEIGFSPVEMEFPSREIDEDIVKNYHKNRDYPARDGTTRLGIHLRFGTVSIRELVKTGLQLNETWLDELVWREFFMMILWHFPQVVDQPFREKYANIKWRNDKKEFRRWCEGTTGYPMVDAGMRQLNETGYMHNRVRMIVASFLTKHLLIDWRWGEKYFAERLLDFELSSNNGNWQWAAGCGCDAVPYFRIFNPEMQLKKFDPDLEYVRKWVPELSSNDYPEPMVEHKFARTRALDVYKKAVILE